MTTTQEATRNEADIAIRGLCIHCGQRVRASHRRFCWLCRDDPVARAKYVPVSIYACRGYGLGRTGSHGLDKPTRALPGSRRKLAVLRRRARKGLELWHPEDAVGE